MQPAGRLGAGQGDDPAAIMLGEAPRPAGSWPVAEPVDALGVEPVQPLPHRLRVATQLGGDLGGARPVPAVGDHAGALDPVARGVAAGGELADLAFLVGILWGAGVEQLGHGAHPPVTARTASEPTSMSTHIEERSINGSLWITVVGRDRSAVRS